LGENRNKSKIAFVAAVSEAWSVVAGGIHIEVDQQRKPAKRERLRPTVRDVFKVDIKEPSAEIGKLNGSQVRYDVWLAAKPTQQTER
jgi:hypothetical protein